MSSMRDADARKRVGPMVREDDIPALSHFEPEKNIVVKAAAGTGKTTALIGRMVALVRKGLSPKDMAAITFTREASGEMRTEFKDALRKTAQLPEQDEESIQSALQKADEAFIDTIHAFCTQILRENEEKSDVPPGFSVVEPDEEENLRRRVWDDHLRASNDSKHLEALSKVGVDTADLYHFYSDWCAFCDLPIASASPETKETPDLEPAMTAIRTFMQEWEPIAPLDDPDDLTELFQETHRLQSQGALNDQLVQYNLLTEFESVAESKSVTYTRWTDTTESDRLRQEGGPLDELRDTLRPVLRERKEYVHAHAAAFVEEAVRDQFYNAGRRYGSLTFQHLLLYTRDLLRDSPEVRETLQKRYETILVDEFQDTDPVQAEILFYLTGRHTEEKDWWRCEPEPGRLFVVGDGKQSIYRFRRADHRVFGEVESLIRDQEKRPVETFQTNFRSTPAVCESINMSFKRVMNGEEPRVKYNDLQANKDPFDGDIGLAELGVEYISGNWASSIADIEGARIARFITSVCEGNLQDTPIKNTFEEQDPSYGDFMLLARTAKRFPQYARHLSEADIPFTIAGSKGLPTDVAVRTLVDLLTVALRPSDGEARAAYLSGLLVGLSDRELYQVCHELSTASGKPVNLNRLYQPRNLRKGNAPEDLLQAVRAAYDLEQEVRRRLENNPVSAVIDWLIEEEGLLAHAALDQKGDLETGALLRVQNEIGRMEANGIQGWKVVEQLRAVLQGDRDIEAMTHREGEDDVVRLMTVHQAKGLDAPFVFLVDPYDRKGGHDPKSHVSRPEEPGVGEPRLHLPVRRPTGPHSSERIGEPPEWEKIKEREARHQQAEEERIAYVAATRAERLLVVSRYRYKDGSVKKDPEKAPWWPLYHALDERESPTLEDLYTSGSPSSSDFEELPPLPDFETWEKSQIPSYQTESVTERVKDRSETLSKEGGHYTEDSEAFGSSVHKLFEWAVYHRQSLPSPEREREVARSLLKETYPGFAPKDFERAMDMLETFCESSLWDDLQAASTVYPEHTLTLHKDGTVVRGTIDLLYKAHGNWHIVDYKTGRVHSESLSDSLEDHPYTEQLHQYADAWESVAGEPVADAALWFADTGTTVEVVR